MQQESRIDNNKHAQEPIDKNVTVRADKKITKWKSNCDKSRSTGSWSWNTRIFADFVRWDRIKYWDGGQNSYGIAYWV